MTPLLGGSARSLGVKLVVSESVSIGNVVLDIHPEDRIVVGIKIGKPHDLAGVTITRG